MNGQFPLSASPSGSAAAPEDDARQHPDAARLIAALLVSCLLHSSVVILPYLGSGDTESLARQEGGQELPRGLTATLTSIKKTPRNASDLFRQGEQIPESSRLSVHSAEAARPSRPRREGTDLLPLQAPIYYATDQLSKRPQPLSEVALDTPEIRPIIASGKMILKLWISELGKVVEVEVEKSELPEAFSSAAINAFKQLQFTAGERHGQPVGSVMRIEVSYIDGRLPPR